MALCESHRSAAVFPSQRARKLPRGHQAFVEIYLIYDKRLSRKSKCESQQAAQELQIQRIYVNSTVKKQSETVKKREAS